MHIIRHCTRARPIYRPLFDFFDDIGIGSYAADVSRYFK
uniref:Uncharacterized protein n=1 Tax=Anguilla anguilla TaxID=7936 RepID=A0A0E9XUH2_ANGAN